MIQPADIKADLTQSLRNLHLPTIRQCYEEVARQAEREQLPRYRVLGNREPEVGLGPSTPEMDGRRHLLRFASSPRLKPS
jgi:hypothetical protein